MLIIIQCKLKTYIYILYYESSLLNYLPPNPVSDPYKIKYFICNGGVGTAKLQAKEAKLVNITS